ncbi:unnamed protein product, partial [Porites lobata]
VDDLGPWELTSRKSKMAGGRQCRRHSWFSLVFHLFCKKNVCAWQIEHEACIVILRGHLNANPNQKLALISRTVILSFFDQISKQA